MWHGKEMKIYTDVCEMLDAYICFWCDTSLTFNSYIEVVDDEE